jgi:hypothetical protein
MHIKAVCSDLVSKNWLQTCCCTKHLLRFNSPGRKHHAVATAEEALPFILCDLENNPFPCAAPIKNVQMTASCYPQLVPGSGKEQNMIRTDTLAHDLKIYRFYGRPGIQS